MRNWLLIVTALVAIVAIAVGTETTGPSRTVLAPSALSSLRAHPRTGADSAQDSASSQVNCRSECVTVRIESIGPRRVHVVLESPREGVHLPGADAAGALFIATPATVDVPRAVDSLTINTKLEGVRIFFEAGSTAWERRQAVWGTSITLVRRDSGFAPIVRIRSATPISE